MMDFDYFPIKKGDVVVNLGAHRGGATKFYSNKVGRGGLVLSIEPLEENFMLLHHNTKHLSNVRIIRCAIGDETKTGVLYIGTHHGNSSIVREFNGGTEEVKVIKWDELMEQQKITKVKVAKIDVEGSEIECLHGMTHTLPQHIIMEEHSRFAYPLEELTNLLKEKGYKYVKEGYHIYASR